MTSIRNQSIKVLFKQALLHGFRSQVVSSFDTSKSEYQLNKSEDEFYLDDVYNLVSTIRVNKLVESMDENSINLRAAEEILVDYIGDTKIGELEVSLKFDNIKDYYDLDDDRTHKFGKSARFKGNVYFYDIKINKNNTVDLFYESDRLDLVQGLF